MKEEKFLDLASSSVLFCCAVLALTSCSERQSENKIEKLSQLQFAIVHEQSEIRADEVALNQAIATGASAETIAALRQDLASDEALLRAYVAEVYSIEYDGFADFPRYPLNR